MFIVFAVDNPALTGKRFPPFTNVSSAIERPQKLPHSGSCYLSYFQLQRVSLGTMVYRQCILIKTRTLPVAKGELPTTIRLHEKLIPFQLSHHVTVSLVKMADEGVLPLFG